VSEPGVKTCPECGKDFVPCARNVARQVYCSRACKDRRCYLARVREKTPVNLSQRVCPECRKKFLCSCAWQVYCPGGFCRYRANSRSRFEKHPGLRMEYARRFRERHPGLHAEYNRRFRARDPERTVAVQRLLRLRKSEEAHAARLLALALQPTGEPT
jgi:hypothetical protein